MSEDLILLDERNDLELGFFKRRKAKKAIKHFSACLDLIPDHWPTHWFIAKVYQVLKDHTKALEHFEKAVDLELFNQNLPREASITAMNAGKVKLAVEYSLEALHREPNDSGLYCNHAVNLMVLGKDDEAMAHIKKAIQMDPDNEINNPAFSLIQSVANGERERLKYHELG